MLTSDKLRIYLNYRGDIDRFSRAGAPGDITDADWKLLDELLQSQHLILKGYASAEFKREVEKKIIEATIDEETREMIRRLPDSFSP